MNGTNENLENLSVAQNVKARIGIVKGKTKRTCIKCNEIKQYDEFDKSKRGYNGHTSVCKKCIEIQKDKHTAHKLFASYRDRFLNFSPRCVICETKDNIHGHHFDYKKPYDIVWLCAKHHRRLHVGKIVVDKSFIVSLKMPNDNNKT